MKIVLQLLFCFLILSNGLIAQNDLDEIRNRFQNAESEEDFEWIMDRKITDTQFVEVNTINSYKAVSRSAMAQYVFNPYSKFKYFFDGRDELEVAIEKNKDVENIFLRLVVQLSIPKFLGYSDDIENDLAYVKSQLPKAKIPLKTKKFIVETIINTGNTNYDLNSLTLLKLQ